jgi:hypothetical protein
MSTTPRTSGVGRMAPTPTHATATTAQVRDSGSGAAGPSGPPGPDARQACSSCQYGELGLEELAGVDADGSEVPGDFQAQAASWARSPTTSTWSYGGRRAAPTVAASPGASPEAAGREISFTGTDTLRLADGKLAEYWANADSLLFFQQLGIREIPAQG